MHRDVEKILFSQQLLQKRVEELGQALMAEYADKNPVFVGVMKGVVVFYADMIRAFSAPCQTDFMWISSYSGTESTGKLLVRKDVSEDLKGRHVVILEDVLDTGRSLSYVCEHILAMEPASLRVCVLLNKPDRRDPAVTLVPDYVGFTIPNEFVVGYGLDYNEQYRNLPYVGVLKPEVYS